MTALPSVLQSSPQDLVRSLDWHSAPPGWLFVLVLLPAVLLFAGYVYSREAGGVGTAMRVFLGTLRALVLLAVLGILFDPFFEKTAFRKLDSHVLVLYDGSQSMRDIKDNYETAEGLRLARTLGLIKEDLPPDLDDPDVAEEFLAHLVEAHPTFDLDAALAAEAYDSRAEVVNELLGQDDRLGLRERLARDHQVLEYVFSTGRAREIETTDEATQLVVPEVLSRDFRAGRLEGLGPETALRDAIRAAIADVGPRPIAGIVVVTDGRSNADRETAADPDESWARRLGVPVHAIGIGNPHPPRNVDLVAVEAEKFVFKDTKAAIEAYVENTGLEGREVEVHLELPPEEARMKTDAEPLVQKLVLGPEGTRQKLLFHHTFKTKGRHKIVVRVTQLPKERDWSDNVKSVEIQVIDEQIRVLYVDGQPRWEYRYLRNALIRDKKLKVNTILLQADQGVPQDKSPDAPEMDRIPTTPEELRDFKRDFHVVILGDFAPTDLGEGREAFLRELKNWVESEFFGGGLIVMAGQQATPEMWLGTEIDKMLPVEIEETPIRGTYDRMFFPKLTAAGWESAITRLDPDPETNRFLWTNPEYGLPGVYWYKKVRRARPGANVLLMHPEDKIETDRGSEPMPLVAVARYGHGQTMFVGLDETWRWRFLVEDLYFWRFWKQAIFFMAKRRLLQSDSRWRIWTDKTQYQVGSRIVVHGEVRDEASEPAREAEQTIQYQIRWGEDGEIRESEVRELTLAGVPEQPGKYQGTINLFRPGEYAFWFLAKGDKDVAPTQKGRHTITALATTLETRRPAQDVETLTRIAKASGGSYHAIWDASALPDIEPKTRMEPVEKSEMSVWNNAWVYAALVALLAIEWIGRKLNRML